MRILIIEDQKEIADFIQESLRAEYFEADVAYDGEQGSFLARTNDYALVILDCILPKMSGEEVLKEIRADKPGMPILILTIKAELSDKIDGFAMGADDYMVKPFLFQELLARIKAILRRPTEIEKSVYKIDDLIVDTNKHHVKRAGNGIYLTRKELMLLEYLLTNKGNVVSRAAILENVWDINADPFSNTIESHILNLRKKIDLPGHKPLIHTIVGRGYKLDARK